MPISIVCPACTRSLRLRDELAGRKIRCRHCEAVLRVPAASTRPEPQESRRSAAPERKLTSGKRRSTADAAGSRQTPLGDAGSERSGREREPSIPEYNNRYRAFLDAFEAEHIEPVPITSTYRLAIALVCASMLALPFLYLGTIVAVSLLLPVVILPLLLFLIVKPLLSGFGSRTGRRALDRDDEPLLFDFVDRVCEAVHAPYPKRINIDSQVNASASFRRGMLSMFGNDLTLTIGMPLVAGLNSRQFAGVLAHEFAHFAQGTGMRVSYLVRLVSMWFTRIVYERDRMDEWLESASENAPSPLNAGFYAVRGVVWGCRRVVWVFMMAGHLVSGYILRQMEYDADRHEARLAGSRCFADTARRLLHMTVAHQGALEDLGEFYREGRLADNLPRLIIANIEQFDDKVLAKIRKLVSKTETGMLDTHPCDRDRVASVKQERTEGIFRLERPATHLFRRYDYQARAVTWDMYREIFGTELRNSDIHPVEQLLARQRHQQENYKALFRYFQSAPAWYRPLHPPAVALKPAPDSRAAIARLTTARQRMIDLADGYADAWKKYDRADTRLIECELAASLLRARLRVPADLSTVPLQTHDDIEKRSDAAHYIQGKQEPLLAPFETAAAERLYSALRLLLAPEMHARLPHHEALAREVRELVDVFAPINSRLTQLLGIRNDQIVLGLLMSMLQNNENNRRLISHIFETMSDLYDQVLDLHEVLSGVPYPFDHADREMTVGRFMLPELPEDENPAQLYEAASAIGNSLPAIQTRVLGRMCQIAELVEDALGLQRLPQPELDEDEEDEDDD